MFGPLCIELFTCFGPVWPLLQSNGRLAFSGSREGGFLIVYPFNGGLHHERYLLESLGQFHSALLDLFLFFLRYPYILI